MNENNTIEVGKALIGFVVIGTSEDYDEDGYAKIILANKKGEKFHIEPSRDPEGNGPGFLFFAPEE